MAVLSILRRRRSRADAKPPTEAIVLSGGGSFGAIQIGALRALFEAGIKPDLFVGCSVGGLNAAFMAADPSLRRLDELEELWRSLDRRNVFVGSTRTVASHIVRRDDHIYEPDALRLIIKRAGIEDLSQTVVPCHVVTTDLFKAETVLWSSGSALDILQASASLPAIFPPVQLNGSLHVDGGVTSPVPAQYAADLGAQRIWVLDVSGGSLGRRDMRMNALDVLLLSFAISRYRLAWAPVNVREGQRVVRLPRIDQPYHDMRDFSRTPEFIEYGLTAGRQIVADELTKQVS